MIKNIEKVDHLESVKLKSFEIISRILKASPPVSIWAIALIEFLILFPKASILFLTFPFSPTYANYPFLAFLPIKLSASLGFNEDIISIVFLIVVTMILLMLLLNMVSKPWNNIVVIFSYCLKLFRFLNVPCAYLLIYFVDNLLNNSKLSTADLVTYAMFSIFVSVLFVFMTVFVFFEIRPLRYQNLLWNYSNDNAYADYFICLVRVLIFYIAQSELSFYYISLGLQVLKMQVQGEPFNKKIRILRQNTTNLMIIAHVFVIYSIIFESKEVAFICFCVSFLGCLFYSLICFLHQTADECRIPICIPENKFNIYNFYMNFKDHKKSSSFEVYKMACLHKLVCKSPNCIFLQSNNAQDIDVEELGNMITPFFKKFKSNDPQSQILYQLWKIELSKNTELSHNMRNFSLHHQFIAYYILGPKESSEGGEETSLIGPQFSYSGQKSLNYKWRFLKQLYLLLDRYQQLTNVLGKSRPQLNKLISCLTATHENNKKLNEIFEEIIKLKEVNYSCIEIYFKFFRCFMDERRLNKYMIEKVKRIKIKTDDSEINENSVPAFIVEANTQIIDRVNAQALKFLRARRIDIKDKVFTTLILPELPLNQLYELSRKDQRCQIPIFFKSKMANSQFILQCRNISLQPLHINNKAFYMVRVYKRNFSSNIIEIMIDQNEAIVGSSQNQVILKFKESKVVMKIQCLYEKHIQPVLQSLKEHKIGRVNFGTACLVTGHLIEKSCPYPNKRLISMSVMNKASTKVYRKRMISNKTSSDQQQNFVFSYYKREEDKLILEGSRESVKSKCLVESYEIKSLSSRVQTILASIIAPSFKQYGKGIKIYRLYYGDLYNIDLEDKQKYESEFNSMMETASLRRKLKFEVSELCLVIFLVVLSVVLMGSGIYLTVEVEAQIKKMKISQTKLEDIEFFNLNFNRIMSIMRDVALGLFEATSKDYQAPIMDSYTELQKYSGLAIFSSEVETCVFAGEKYQGNLNELVEACLSHVYDFLQVRNITFIEDIHNNALYYLGPLIETNKKREEDSIKDHYQTLMYVLVVTCLLIFVCTIAFCIGYLILSHKHKRNMEVYLRPLLITPEAQIKRLAEESEKFKTAIVGLSKNYEVDAETFGSKPEETKKKSRPKSTNFSLVGFLIESLPSIFAFLILLGLCILNYVEISSQAKNLLNVFQYGRAVVEVYSEMTWITNELEHTGVIYPHKILEISEQLSLIENSKNKNMFSSKLTEMIRIVFFQDSCSFLYALNILQKQDCDNLIPEFQIKAPYKIGLDLYFRRLHYNLIIDIAQTYPSTGLYSDTFKRIFAYFSNAIKSETVAIADNCIKYLRILNILMILMTVLLICVATFISIRSQQKIHQIEEGLISLNFTVFEENEKEKIDKKETIVRLHSSTENLLLEDEDFVKQDII